MYFETHLKTPMVSACLPDAFLVKNLSHLFGGRALLGSKETQSNFPGILMNSKLR